MLLKDTKINIGGLMRCCIQTIVELDPDKEYIDGTIIDCKFEADGNKQIVLKDGIWQWNNNYGK